MNKKNQSGSNSISKLIKTRALLILILLTISLQGMGQVDTTVHAILVDDLTDKKIICISNFINIQELRTNVKDFTIISFEMGFMCDGYEQSVFSKSATIPHNLKARLCSIGYCSGEPPRRVYFENILARTPQGDTISLGDFYFKLANCDSTLAKSSNFKTK